MGPEAKFYQQIKRNFKEFSLIRLENSSLLGTPDLLVYNNNGHFCTVELKVTKGNSIRFSPHQIAFHTRHNQNTFILAKTLGPCSSKSSPISMYRGSRIRELAACGLSLEACCLGLDACRLMLAQVGLKAWRLKLDAWSLLLEARIRCTLYPTVVGSPANDLIRYSTREFFSVHRSKHLKLICPSKRGNPCTCCPEAVPGMLHQFF